METIKLEHCYNGTRIGQNSQDTKLCLRGCVDVEAAVEMFKHFVGAVWGREIEIRIVGIEDCKEKQTRVIGFNVEECNATE